MAFVGAFCDSAGNNNWPINIILCQWICSPCLVKIKWKLFDLERGQCVEAACCKWSQNTTFVNMCVYKKEKKVLPHLQWADKRKAARYVSLVCKTCSQSARETLFPYLTERRLLFNQTKIHTKYDQVSLWYYYEQKWGWCWQNL